MVAGKATHLTEQRSRPCSTPSSEVDDTGGATDMLDKTVIMLRKDSRAIARRHAAPCKLEAAINAELDRIVRLPRRAAAMMPMLALAAYLGGCQTQTVLPPSADARAQFSEIGVNVSSATLAAPAEPTTDAGSAAAYGAGQGAASSLGFGAAFCTVGEPIL